LTVSAYHQTASLPAGLAYVAQPAPVIKNVDGQSVKVIGPVTFSPNGQFYYYATSKDGQLTLTWSIRQTNLGASNADVSFSGTLTQSVNTAPNGPVTQVTISPALKGNRRGAIYAIDQAGRLIRRNWNSASSTPALYLSLDYPCPWFEGTTVYPVGDWNNDGHEDLLGRTADGKLYLYSTDQVGGTGYQTGVQIGRGWSGYQIAPAGDLTGDGNQDLLAVRLSDGNLYLYEGNGHGGFKPGPYRQVGRGWQNFQVYAAGDANQDGQADILGVSQAGDLYYYPGKGDGTFKASVKAGRGWSGMLLGAGGDLDADGLADIVGVSTKTRQLLFYKALGNGRYGPAQLLDKNW
jgi:hypothetical protein